MKKVKALIVFMLSCMLVLGTLSTAFGQDNDIRDRIISFLSQSGGKSDYTSSDSTLNQTEFVKDAWKYIYGTELVVSASAPKYNVTSSKKIPSMAVMGDVIVFTKGNDVLYMLYSSGSKDSFEYYSISTFPYTNGVKLYDDDNSDSKFMKGRFKDGTFTVIHSANYAAKNHIHAYNHDGYCTCGKPKNGEITDMTATKYCAVARCRIYSLPYSGSTIVSSSDASLNPIYVTGYVTNLDNEIWYRVNNIYITGGTVGDGWIKGSTLSDTPMNISTAAKNSIGITGTANKDGVQVKRLPYDGSLLLETFNKGDSVVICKKVLGWYQIEYKDDKNKSYDNTNVGYIRVSDIDLAK